MARTKPGIDMPQKGPRSGNQAPTGGRKPPTQRGPPPTPATNPPPAATVVDKKATTRLKRPPAGRSKKATAPRTCAKGSDPEDKDPDYQEVPSRGRSKISGKPAGRAKSNRHSPRNDEMAT